MNRNWKWGAAVIVAGVMVAQVAMAGPIRDIDYVDNGFSNNGAQRGQTATETMRDSDTVELPGGRGALRGWAAVESPVLGGFRIPVWAIGCWARLAADR